MLLRLWRLAAVFAWVICYAIQGLWIDARISDPIERRRRHRLRTAWQCRRFIRMLGFRARLVGRWRRIEGGQLLISNHMSYTDVLALMGFRAAVFVTSVEIQQTPFLGQMCAWGGALFVERRDRRRAARDADMLAQTLKHHDVVLYPEGTSSDGSTVLPFRSSLLRCAEQAAVPIQPVVLSYPRIDGQDFGPQNADVVAWYGDMDFFPHLWRLLAVRRIDVTIRILPPVDDILDRGRKAVCADIETTIREHYRRDAGLID